MNRIGLAQDGMQRMTRDSVAGDVNAKVVRTLMEEVLHAGRMHLLPELIAPEYIGHLPIGDHYGPEGVRIEFTAYREAIDGLTVSLEHVFAVEDQVARRFTLSGAIPGRDHPVILHGIAIDRLENGRLVESWVQIDTIPDASL
jgi:hypothetical protein